MTTRDTTVHKTSSYGQVFMLVAWGFVIVISSFIFFYIGLLDGRQVQYGASLYDRPIPSGHIPEHREVLKGGQVLLFAII